jgi:hypothetical protein
VTNWIPLIDKYVQFGEGVDIEIQTLARAMLFAEHVPHCVRDGAIVFSVRGNEYTAMQVGEKVITSPDVPFIAPALQLLVGHKFTVPAGSATFLRIALDTNAIWVMRAPVKAYMRNWGK